MPTQVGRRHIPPFPELSKIKNPDPRVVLEKALQLTQDWGRQLVDFFAGLPATHAETHKGAGDSVSGTTSPTAITPGQAAALGDPLAGFAPIGHVHGGTLLKALTDLEDLASATVELLGGREMTYVYNPYVTRLLEEILFEVKKLAAAYGIDPDTAKQRFDEFDKRLTALGG